ncbi:hypothetical protein Tco_0736969 [Tanacetum coccineum]
MHTVTTPNANPVASQTSGPIGPPQYAPSGHASSYVPAQLYGSPIVPPGFYYPLAHPYYPVQPHLPAHQSPPQAQQSLQPQYFGYPVMGPVSQAQPVSTIGQPTASAGSTSPTITSDQATTLPHAFTLGTLHDPAIGAWNMDTGASSHLNNSVTNLCDIFNTCIYPSVSVGDGHSIPATNTGHSILPTPFRSLYLNNVLITPHIVKNLKIVRQFVRDNNCTIKFDAFGFSAKDFMTRRVLLRCDSTGDLYPVMASSPIPHVFLVSQQHMWHKRLGHPGGDVLRLSAWQTREASVC